MTAFRFGESLYWAAIEHQHQYPRAGPKEPHSSLLPLLSAGNSLALGPSAVAFVMNEKGSKKLAGTGAGARAGMERSWEACSCAGLEMMLQQAQSRWAGAAGAVRSAGAEVPERADAGLGVALLH